jgi:hypothetical protein
MNGSSSLHRLTRILVLGAVLAGATASVAAGGVTRPPDVRDVAGSLGQAYVGSPPDVRDVAATTLSVPDVLERYATAHPYGAGLSSPTTSTLAVRPPDVRDAAEAARFVPVAQPSSGFDWNDWAIGIGSGMGIALLLAGGLAAGLQRRHRMQTA